MGTVALITALVNLTIACINLAGLIRKAKTKESPRRNREDSETTDEEER